MIMLYAALVLWVVAVALFVSGAAGAFTPWWYRRIHGYASWMAIEFEAMFQDMTIERAKWLITVMIGGGALFGLLVASSLGGRLLAAAVFGFAGYFGPWGLVKYLHRRRLNTIDDQLVDTLQMMANALRAGLSLQQSIELAAREMKPPMADELARVVKEIHLGRLMDDALRMLKERVPLEDVRLVVESILTLRETGGNLTETFQVIATTVVERKKVQGKIKAMTAQGMSQGLIVGSMPIAMMLLFSFIDPNYMRPFFNTALGWLMMLVVFVLDGLGVWMMIKLVQIEV